MQTVLSFLAIATLAVFSSAPTGVRAAEIGSVTENFSSGARRNERATYAFWDTRSREVSLPLQYTFSSTEGVLPSTETRLRFSEVAPEFSRLPQGRVSDSAPVVSDIRFRYVLQGGVLYTSLGDGIVLNADRVPEFKGRAIRAIAAAVDKLKIAWITSGKSFVGEITLTGFTPSAALETKALTQAGYGKVFEKATLEAEAEIPEGTHIEYFLSADGGVHWESVLPGVEHEFAHYGGELRLRAVLFTDNITRTPYLRKMIINFEKDQIETPTLRRSRDSRRLADLRNLRDKLEKFRRERFVYPIVDDQKPEVRLELLGQLMVDGRYLTQMPQDPLYGEDRERFYDYVSSKTGEAYILRARLEDVRNKNFERDTDGKPVEPYLYEYTCDDPWYCEGKGFVVVNNSAPPPEPRGTVELLQIGDGRIYRIATVGGGATPQQKRKLYIPSYSVIERLKEFYTQIQRADKAELVSLPRVRLIKTADKNDVYYLTETWLKRRLPSWEVFLSYQNSPHEIAVVQPEELASYGESRLIRLTGDNRVWYLEGGVRRLVRSPTVMRARGFKWEHIAPVNFPEYNSYPEGESL